MPLDSTNTAAIQTQQGLFRLSPKTWLQKVQDYARAKREHSRLEGEARAAKSVVDAAKSELLAAMQDHPAALCGTAVLTRKDVKPSAATLTLSDGRVIRWNEVTSILVGNVTVPAAAVAKMYGGRDGYVSLDVAGA